MTDTVVEIGAERRRREAPVGESGAMHGPARDQLRAFIERIEHLAEEKKAVADDMAAVFAEAKAAGFDTKTMRAIIRLRRLDKHERQEMEALLECYLLALGMM